MSVLRPRVSSSRIYLLIALSIAIGCARVPREPGPRTDAALALAERDRWLDSVSRLLDDAVYRENVVPAANARDIMERLLTQSRNDGLLLHYHGYTLIRHAMIAWGDGKTDIPALLRAADSSLHQSAEYTPMAETYALMARINGFLSSFYPRRGAELGAASRVARAEADRLGRDNPRVWLLRGQAAANTPAVHGGGPEVTEQALLRAVALFDNDTVRAPFPRWGRAEAHAVLGEHYIRVGRIADARSQLERALALAPAYALVRDSLLPLARRSDR